MSIRQIVASAIHSCGYELRRRVECEPAGRAAVRVEPLEPPRTPYVENPEFEFRNLALKRERAAAGGPFEYPEIILLNKTVAGLVREDEKRIAELGSGIGCFAYQVSADPTIEVVSSEFDEESSEWAVRNRGRPNIHYTTGPITPADGPFDLVVSVEVIEHVPDYRGFLETCCRLAPKAILTTPNNLRPRHRKHVTGPPQNRKHVREWTAGEFYWVLRCFYRDVRLFGRWDDDEVGCVPIAVNDERDRLIAACADPIAGVRRMGKEGEHVY